MVRVVGGKGGKCGGGGKGGGGNGCGGGKGGGKGGGGKGGGGKGGGGVVKLPRLVRLVVRVMVSWWYTMIFALLIHI